MSKISIADIERVVKPRGYQAERAASTHVELFENDISDADKYDFGRSRLQDWKAEIRATLEASGDSFIVSSPNHGGAALFGTTAWTADIAQIWLLQSKSFALEAAQLHGAAWPYQAITMTDGVVRTFTAVYPLIFNFIPRKQRSTIRWLKCCGFSFYTHNDLETDMLFFGQGPGTQELSQNTALWRNTLGQGLYA